VSRKLLIQSTSHPYHVVARINNREKFPCDLAYAWKVLTDELDIQSMLHEIRVHAFVLMPNHIHLLVTTPRAPISKAMQGFLSSSTRIINTRTRRTGHLFGSHYYWSLVHDPFYFAHVVKYVYRNPVKAGLCARVEEYVFSTFSGLAGLAPLPLRMYPYPKESGSLIPVCFEELEKWLNQPHQAEEAAAIQKGLMKKKFQPPVNRNNRKRMALSAIDAPPLPNELDTKWWAHLDLNQGPRDYESPALTN
jgi:putative transposase